MDDFVTEFNERQAAKSREVCERIEREDAERRSKLSDLMGIERKAELGRAKAEADGWRKVAERRLKHIDECEAALAKRNERIAKLEKQVADLRAELANAKVPTERERQIIGMWPKFGDGEYVRVGDAVEAHHDGAIIVDAIEFSRGKVCVKDAEDGDWNTSMYAMHPLKRPAPKVLDADGVEIKVGDTVWHRSGFGHGVVTSINEDSLMGTVSYVNGCKEFIDVAKDLTHARPDSWERLEEDAEKIRRDIAHNLGDFSPSDFDDERDTVQFRVTDLVRRAKALAGVGAARDED